MFVNVFKLTIKLSYNDHGYDEFVAITNKGKATFTRLKIINKASPIATTPTNGKVCISKAFIFISVYYVRDFVEKNQDRPSLKQNEAKYLF